MAFGWITLKSGDRISLVRSSPFFAVHLACLAAFFLKFHWSYVIVCLALYYIRMFFVTAGYHRYFSHRSFKTSRAFQFVMAFMATMSTQKGVLGITIAIRIPTTTCTLLPCVDSCGRTWDGSYPIVITIRGPSSSAISINIPSCAG